MTPVFWKVQCIREPKKNCDVICGHYKDRNDRYDRNIYDNNLLISPLDPQCENRFRFSNDGRIEPVYESDLAARTTIDQLGLNNGDLPEKRKFLIDIFSGSIGDFLTENDIEDFSLDDQRKFAQQYMARNSDGSFNEFWTTMRYLLEQLPAS